MSLTWRERGSMDELSERGSRCPDSRAGAEVGIGTLCRGQEMRRVIGQCRRGRRVQTAEDQVGGCILQKAQENVFLLMPVFLAGS